MFQSNTNRKKLEFFFKYPHLKTFYKGTILDFKSIVSIYDNIVFKKSDSAEIFGNTFYGLEPVNYYTLDEVFTSDIYHFKCKTEQPLIVDCGANIGLSMLYFKRIFPKAKIHAFEPDTKNYEYFLKNVKSFGWETSVFPYQKLVSNTDGYEFFEELGNAGSKISKNDSGKRIEKIRLKDFLLSLESKINFLKIDIEGSEFDVLPDLKSIFPKIEKMYIEFHLDKNNFQEFYQYIEGLLGDDFNFQITTNFLENENIYESIGSGNSKTYYNVFAVNKIDG